MLPGGVDRFLVKTAESLHFGSRQGQENKRTSTLRRNLTHLLHGCCHEYHRFNLLLCRTRRSRWSAEVSRLAEAETSGANSGRAVDISGNEPVTWAAT